MGIVFRWLGYRSDLSSFRGPLHLPREKALVYHYDHLGSITATTDFGATTIANDTGGKAGKFSEDAWGQRRNPTTWSGVPTTTDDGGADSVTPRGFTGHEMLDDLGLVHMNGRIYDSLLGRFLSADIQVQYPDDLQSYNRYSYVSNSPLSFTDPSGYGEEMPFYELPPFVVDAKKVGEKGSAFSHGGYRYLVLTDRLSNGGVQALRLDFLNPNTPAKVDVSMTNSPISLPTPTIDPADLAAAVEQAATAASDAVTAAADQAAGDGPDEKEPEQSTARKVAGFVPVVGSTLDAIDAYKKGNYGMMALNIGLAISDLSGGTALVKGLTVGTMKFASRAAIKSIRMNTKNWKNMNVGLQKIGETVKNSLKTNRGDWVTTDHIFFKQKGKWPHWLLNHPANLQTGAPLRLNQMFEGMGHIERSMYWSTWMKASAGGTTSYGAGWFVGSGSEPQ